jgi:rubrerythrin
MKCDVCGVKVTPNPAGDCPICTSRLTTPKRGEHQ